MIETLSEVLALFCAELDRRDTSVKTLAGYRSDLVLFISWLASAREEPTSPAAITRADIHEYRRYLIEVEQRSPATVNRRLSALRKFFGWARETGRIDEPPTEGVPGMGRIQRTPKTLSRQEVERLLTIVRADADPRNHAVLQLLCETGIRVGELTALRRFDVDCGRQPVIRVRHEPEGTDRSIPLNSETASVLAVYLGTHDGPASDFLFIGRRGKAITPQTVENIVKKYAARAGLPEVTPQTLRHTFGKLALDRGASLVTVAALLGHSTLETTAIYARL